MYNNYINNYTGNENEAFSVLTFNWVICDFSIRKMTALLNDFPVNEQLIFLIA